MISAFHLFWICPIVFTLGFGASMLINSCKNIRKDMDEWEKLNK
jgi:hypothetical protein